MLNLKHKLAAALSGWYIWLFPLFAIIISGALMVEYFKQKGAEIKITFDDATGIQPDKTRVRFRGVTIGKVTRVTITDDAKDVVAHITLDRDSKRFAVDGSKFYLVVPKVGFQGVSGLETLTEGNYITVQPGPNQGPFKDSFKGHIGKEIGDAEEDTVAYFLDTEAAGSLTVGDRITFRGIKIGSVGKVNLSKKATSVNVQLNIQPRYTKLIRSNTAFWRKMAVQAKLGLFNSELKIGSLDSLLSGGIEIGTPMEVGEVAKPGTRFYLLPTPPKNSEKWNPAIDF